MKNGNRIHVVFWALPLVLFTILLDQVTKVAAINQLCTVSGLACADVEGRLVDYAVRGPRERIDTFFPFIELDFHLNTNAALSIPIPGPPAMEFVILFAIMFALAAWLWREGGRQNAIGVGLILGGAIGNVIDRLMHGAVVDFLALHYGSWTAFIFNVADAAITLGVIWLFAEQLILRPRRNAQAVVS